MKKLFSEDINVGSEHKTCWHASEEKCKLALKITGDSNKLHSESDIVPGMLLYGFASATVSESVADGSRVILSSMKFRKIVNIGDTGYVCIRVLRKSKHHRGHGRITFNVRIYSNSEKRDLLNGECDVLVPERQKPITVIEEIREKGEKLQLA